MARNNNAHKLNLEEPDETIVLSDADLEKLIVQEEEVDKEPSKEVEKAISEVREALNLKKVTLNVPDTVFEKPLTESNIIPERMHAVSGNEEGDFEAVMGDSPVYAVTERGLKVSNDDGFLVDPESKTVVVTDGLGGYKGGFVASSIAHYTIARNIKKPLEEIPMKIHRNIGKYQKNNPRFEKMSTTMIAARQKSTEELELVHVGDSRAIVIREGKIVFQTKDDNYLEVLMKKDGIKNEKKALEKYEEKYYKYRNLVTQACGIGYIDTENFVEDKERVEPNSEKFKTKKGDIVILCSDGLTDNLSNKRVAEIIKRSISQGKSIKEAVTLIKNEALETMRTWEGKPDNIAIAGYIVK